MSVNLTIPFNFKCNAGEEKRLDVVAHAPLPAPMAQRFNLERIVALGDNGNGSLDGWEIVALRVMDGQKIGDIVRPEQGPIPAAVFSCVAVGTSISAPFGPGDTLTCVVRNTGAHRASLLVHGIVRPRDWLFFCHNCGASVWMSNPRELAPPISCDFCGAPLIHYGPRDGDSGTFRELFGRPWKEDGRRRRQRPESR